MTDEVAWAELVCELADDADCKLALADEDFAALDDGDGLCFGGASGSSSDEAWALRPLPPDPSKMT